MCFQLNKNILLQMFRTMKFWQQRLSTHGKVDEVTIECCVRAYPVYKDVCTRKPINATNRYPVTVTKNEEIVGQLARKLSKVCSLFIGRGGSTSFMITGDTYYHVIRLVFFVLAIISLWKYICLNYFFTFNKMWKICYNEKANYGMVPLSKVNFIYLHDITCDLCCRDLHILTPSVVICCTDIHVLYFSHITY